jgi:DeoR/GlpR family transcriptional regulator of sugar metabolism
LTNPHGLLIDIQRAVIRAAHRAIFCLDHTKFGRRSVTPLCGLEEIDTIVTDGSASGELVEGLRARGIEIIVASSA